MINQASDWLANNEWILKYFAFFAWFGGAIVLKDLVFGIHWLRDLILPIIFVIFTICIYIFI